MTPSRIFASLVLAGDEFDPDYVTTQLHHDPTYVRRKGERIRNTDHCFDHTEWGIEIPEKKDISFDAVMAEMTTIIPVAPEVMRALAEELNAEWNILFSYYIDYDFPFIGIEGGFLQYAATIHAVIGFDPYPNVLYDDKEAFGDD